FQVNAAGLTLVLANSWRQKERGWGEGRSIIGRHGEGEDTDEADRERDEPAGDLLQAEERAAEEGLGAVGALRRRGRAHHLLFPGEAPPVLQLQVPLTSSPTRPLSPSLSMLLFGTCLWCLSSRISW
ncbi:hypothetical protein MUK42_09834, partial [Musa troglodytarum]